MDRHGCREKMINIEGDAKHWKRIMGRDRGINGTIYIGAWKASVPTPYESSKTKAVSPSLDINLESISSYLLVLVIGNARGGSSW